MDDGRIPAPKQVEGIQSMQTTHLKIDSEDQKFAVLTQLHQGILATPDSQFREVFDSLYADPNSMYAEPPEQAQSEGRPPELRDIRDLLIVRTSKDKHFAIDISRADDKGPKSPIQIVAERTFLVGRGGESPEELNENTIAPIKTKVCVTISQEGKIDNAKWTWQVIPSPSNTFLEAGRKELSP